MLLFFSFSLNDAIDFLMNIENKSDKKSFSDEDDHDLAMLPPIETANAGTDWHGLWCIRWYEWWSLYPICQGPY